jgi:hypothetical protein
MGVKLNAETEYSTEAQRFLRHLILGLYILSRQLRQRQWLPHSPSLSLRLLSVERHMLGYSLNWSGAKSYEYQKRPSSLLFMWSTVRCSPRHTFWTLHTSTRLKKCSKIHSQINLVLWRRSLTTIFISYCNTCLTVAPVRHKICIVSGESPLVLET